MKGKLLVSLILSASVAFTATAFIGCAQPSDGKSAYEIWLEAGHSGSEVDFLEWLKGTDGKDGTNGQDGADGANGQDGKDGTDGQDGKSAYEIWLSAGHSGSEADFLEWLKGQDGTDGANGQDGKDGADGQDGKSAYEIWLAAGHEGTEEDFLAWLRGDGEGTKGLEYYLLDDGTYAVGGGTTKYLSEIVILATYDGVSVTKIVDYAFSSNSFAGYSFKTITIPESVTEIGNNAFYDCSLLETVNYIGTPEQWEKIKKGTGNDFLDTATINFVNPSIQTYTFEAEDVVLDGKSGPGLSGAANEKGMIMTSSELNVSNNKFLGYQYDMGCSISFIIVSDSEVSDATIILRLSAEYRDITIDTQSYRISLNDNDLNYSITFKNVPTFGDDEAQESQFYALPFEDYVIAQNMTLNEGVNIITLTTNNMQEQAGTTMLAAAPLIDCLKITTSAVLSWSSADGYPADNY